MDILSWFALNDIYSFAPYAAYASLVILEIIYAVVLMHDPSPERRARGYSQLLDALESTVYGALLLGAIVFVSSTVIVGVDIVGPDKAKKLWEDSFQVLFNYLYHMADIQKWLSLTVIFSPFIGTLQSSSFLLVSMAHYIIFVSSAMIFITEFVTKYGSYIISAGLGLTSTRRFRRLGPYLVFSVLAMAVASGGLAPVVNETIHSLNFVQYQDTINWLHNTLGSIDITRITSAIITVGGVITEAITIIFGQLPQWYIQDGKILAELAVKVTIALALIVATATAASRAAGGIADNIMSRVRGL
jgi:hypothetical protein